MLIKKRQILILTLSAVICLAVYINWRFTQTGLNLDLSETNTDEKTLGEAKFVNTQTNPYFEEAKLSRQKTRDEAQTILNSIINNTNAVEEDKKTAIDKVTALATATETEGRIENLVKSKGFSECVAFFGDGIVSIVVQTDGLTSAQAIQIKDIAVSEAKVGADKIKIIEIK